MSARWMRQYFAGPMGAHGGMSAIVASAAMVGLLVALFVFFVVFAPAA